MLSRLIIPVSLTGLLMLGFWLHQTVEEIDPEQLNASPPRPDYVIHGGRVTELDNQGQPSRYLTAHVIRHFIDRQYTELDEPELTLIKPADGHWTIRSEEGRLFARKDTLYLDGRVRMQRPETPHAQPIEIITSDVRVRQQGSLADTQRAVHIETPEHRIQGVGAKASLEQPVRIQLLSQVESHHVFSP
jgi:LPS export ABC transporter protein LptC